MIDAPEYANRGALAVVGVGYYQSGFAAAEPLARVLAGEKPAAIPLRNVTEKKVIFNLDGSHCQTMCYRSTASILIL